MKEWDSEKNILFSVWNDYSPFIHPTANTTRWRRRVSATVEKKRIYDGTASSTAYDAFWKKNSIQT